MMFSKPYHILNIMKKFLIPFMKDEKETFFMQVMSGVVLYCWSLLIYRSS